MIRIAALGDCHFDESSKDELAPYLARLRYDADLLLIAGDLTRSGSLAEGKTLAAELRSCPVPVVATLGNHDYHAEAAEGITAALRDVGVIVLERQSAVVNVNEHRIGVVGAKGFGGGFPGACASEYGEPEMKAFIRHTKNISEDVRGMLEDLDAPYKVVLLHYSPIEGTLLGERKEIYPFLGSFLLAEAIDDAGADIVFHGHAHRGTEKGATDGGIPVRNVAQPVLRHVFNIYTLDKEGALVPPGPPAAARG